MSRSSLPLLRTGPPARALVAAAAVVVSLLAGTATASAAVVVNEVESDGAVDFVELANTDGAAADIGNYVIKDGGGNTFTIPAGTMIPGNGFYLADALGFGLGGNDEAKLYAPADLVNAVDGYAWTTHAPATYGRCPDGTGPMKSTSGATPGAANDCPGPPVVASPWPGSSAVSIADGGSLSDNLSGLAYQPSGTAAPGVLWAVRNDPSVLYRLIYDGKKWTPDTANGWGNGKSLRYTDGAGAPDAEGVTLAAGDANAIYVSSERNGGGGTRPSVLRYDVSSAGASLTASNEWNLTGDLPPLGANLGLEAITWVPDDLLVAKGLVDESTGAKYNPATHADHGAGLFFVGVEQDGKIIAYALNKTTGTFKRVATIASGFPQIMDLEYEPESTHLWAVCDNGCDGRTATLDIAQSGPNAGKFVVTNTYERPAGMPNLNNEGFAIAPRAECVGGLKPVFWADDSNTGGHELHAGSLKCTVPDAGPAPTPTPAPSQSQHIRRHRGSCPLRAPAHAT